jgi:predicted ATPase with chaperone activity
MPRLETHKIMDWVAGQRGEPENGITGRVLGAASYTDTTLDDASQSLLRAAVRQLSMSPATVRRTLAVARTIANLEAAERIETYHLAEAIQYRPRRR